MKTLLTLTLFTILLVAGCNEEQCRPTAWVLGGTDVDSEDNNIIGRVGLRNTEGIEFGAESNWIGVHGENQSYGAYALAEIEPGPAGTPYIGYHASVANDLEDGGSYGPIVGTIIEIRGVETVIEYQYLDFTGNLAERLPNENDQHRVSAGIRFQF